MENEDRDRDIISSWVSNEGWNSSRSKVRRRGMEWSRVSRKWDGREYMRGRTAIECQIIFHRPRLRHPCLKAPRSHPGRNFPLPFSFLLELLKPDGKLQKFRSA